RGGCPGPRPPAGVAALAAELPRLVGARRLVLVFAVMADKAWPAMLEHLLPSASEVIVTRVGRRGLDPGGLAAAMSGGVPVHAVVDPRAAVRLALERAASGDAVLVTGSLFLAGEAYATLAPGARLFEPWYGWGGCGGGRPADGAGGGRRGGRGVRSRPALVPHRARRRAATGGGAGAVQPGAAAEHAGHRARHVRHGHRGSNGRREACRRRTGA